MTREDFNRLAQLSGQPLVWTDDANGNGVPDASEVVVTQPRVESNYRAAGRWTAGFHRAYRQLVELRRREAVAREFQGAVPTVVLTHTRGFSRPEQAMLRHLQAAAGQVQALYEQQTGAAALRARLASADAPSRALFERNHGPWCQAAHSVGDPFCHGQPDFAPRRSGAYPADMANDAALCQQLAKQPHAAALLSPFTVVRRQGAALVAVGLPQAFSPGMQAVARHLRAAARAIQPVPQEAALHRYLRAAARAFETNEWAPADEAWAAMNARNSRWYLRVAPDEVGFEPCLRKAGLHLTLALIDDGASAWQQRLSPRRQAMEDAVAALLGPVYTARRPELGLPDFVRVILAAGDARQPLGATIGQSLPNWGPVAEEGRGRTLVMSGFHRDAQAAQARRQLAAALLSPADQAELAAEPEPYLLDTLFHEVTHNLGPSATRPVGGVAPEAVLPEGLSFVLEEMKAQYGGMWLLGLLQREGLVSEPLRRQVHLGSLLWAFWMVSRGLQSPTGQPQPYAQLAAVLIGAGMEAGALKFDGGRFSVDHDKLLVVCGQLLQQAGRALAAGDADAARALLERHATGEGPHLAPVQAITRAVKDIAEPSYRYVLVP